MFGYRLAVLLVIVFLLSPIATYTQTPLVQPSTSLSNTGDWQFPSAQRYREISIYSGQTFANPQIMADLGGQHLFLPGRDSRVGSSPLRTFISAAMPM
jgi:hypothetical protein